MNKTLKKILLILAVLIALFLIIFFLARSNITGGVITGGTIKATTYSITKAVCDDTNYCEDYEIQCNGEEIVSMAPTGFAIQNSDSWTDPRTPEQINKLCG